MRRGDSHHGSKRKTVVQHMRRCQVSTYDVYLGSHPISEHATFDEALDAYRQVATRRGAHIRSPHCDVDFDGFTEEQREAMEAVK